MSNVTGYDSYEHRTVLIVEDEFDNYLYAKAVLKKLKLKIIHAEGGKKALEICKNNPNIDLILMDIKMPEMSGFDIYDHIKNDSNCPPVIALTAYAQYSIQKMAIDAGFSEFISKPYSKDELIPVVLKYI
ncbi:MAG: response regulator [Bacteroidales bacterium]|nr:response regulator [Bacteroidales bacterium]